MPSTQSDEIRIATRYQTRDEWAENYGYKEIKGGRIVEVLKETGGLPSLALEIGVGRAGIAGTVSRQGVRVVGIDLSPEILARAQGYARSNNVHLLRASGFALPFRTGSLPLVYASQVLHLFDSPSRLEIMREAHRVLRPGGRFVFDMKNVSTHLLRYLQSSSAKRKQNYPSRGEILDLLREARFSTPLTRPGVLPLLKWTSVPNLGIFRRFAHTTFFVATRG